MTPFAHRDLDPRAKLAFLAAVAVLAVALPRLVPLAALGLVVAAVVATGRGLSVRAWLGFLEPFKLLLPAVFVLNAFFYGGGTVLWSVPHVPVALTTGGVRVSAVIGARLVVLAGVASWFGSTTDQEVFEEALVRLGVPWSFAFTLSLTLRVVPEMRDRFRTIDETQRSRGVVIEGGPISQVRARIPMIVPFLASVIRYGFDLSEALVVRDFGRIPDRERTSLVDLAQGPSDYLLYALSVAVLVGFLVAFAV